MEIKTGRIAFLASVFSRPKSHQENFHETVAGTIEYKNMFQISLLLVFRLLYDTHTPVGNGSS